MKKLLFLFGLCLVAYTCSKGDDNSPLDSQKFTVSVSASDGGSVSTLGGQYYENTSISITATPAQGFEFSGWTGETTLTGSSISVKVTSNLTIAANFIRSKYTLTVNTVGSGEIAQQVINSARGTEEYESGNTIRLTATPQSDFLFYDWEQLLNNISENTYENPLEVVMDSSKTVTATFEEKLPIVNPDDTDKNNTIGKWKIRKKRPGSQQRSSSRAVDCKVYELIFRSDNSFTIITETTTITGQYTIDSENSISLNQQWIAQRDEANIGKLTDIKLTGNYLSFKIELTGVCDEQLEADRDPTYDEETDPLAPSNTGSQTTDTESSTLALATCTIETNPTSDNANQTISLGSSIENITIAVTVGSTCTETLIVSSSNLPEGVTVSLDNNEITVAGTPSSNSLGTFDYGIILNVADPEVILSGQIIVEDSFSNSGTSSTSTSTNTSASTSSNCELKFDFDTPDVSLTAGRTISPTIILNSFYNMIGLDNCSAEVIDASGGLSINFTSTSSTTSSNGTGILPDGLVSSTNIYGASPELVLSGTPTALTIGDHSITLTVRWNSQVISQNFTIKVDADTSTSTNTGTTDSTGS
tara:strand:+ start:9053 stop:10819 length:1767 start_codon:yes stop_codon:yes gene_type:complete